MTLVCWGFSAEGVSLARIAFEGSTILQEHLTSCEPCCASAHAAESSDWSRPAPSTRRRWSKRSFEEAAFDRQTR